METDFEIGAGYPVLVLQILIQGTVLIAICTWAIFALSNAVRADLDPVKKMHRFLIITLFAAIMIVTILSF